MNEIAIVRTAPKPLITLPSLSGLTALHLSRSQKIAVACVCLGIGAVGLLSRYFRRRKVQRRKSALSKHEQESRSSRRHKPINILSPGSEYMSVPGAGGGTAVSPGFHRSVPRQSSVNYFSDRCSSVASSTPGQPQSVVVGADSTTPQQYGVLGMEALGTALTMFEDALASYTNSSDGTGAVALTTQEESEFIQSLQAVIDGAYNLQDQCEHLFLHQHSVLFRGVSPEREDNTSFTGGDVPSTTGRSRTITSASSMDSFVSAQGDIADLKSLEDFDENLYPLFMMAAKLHEDDGIPFRELRTEEVNCSSDAEYISKVHCIRLASQLLFSVQDNRQWFAESGRHIIALLMARANKDSKEVLMAYDRLIEFVDTCEWSVLEEELRGRGVVALTFYDIVLDFILLDAFEDLEKPPSSVIAVVQNRWLSNNFKESALSTAVWSVLKAKRRLLSHQDGFISHFYDVVEYLSPLFAWGFLGPDEELKSDCVFIKTQIMALLRDIFSFTTARYTTVQELSSDILDAAHTRFGIITQHLEGSVTSTTADSLDR